VNISIKNIGKGMRVFKNLKGQDIAIDPGDTRSFEIHPHHARQALRDADKPKPSIEVTMAEDDIRVVKSPGGNMTEIEQARHLAAKADERTRLADLQRQATVVTRGPTPTAVDTKRLKTDDEPTPKKQVSNKPAPEAMARPNKKKPKSGRTERVTLQG
jgi:hypothetical protein